MKILPSLSNYQNKKKKRKKEIKLKGENFRLNKIIQYEEKKTKKTPDSYIVK